VVIFFHVGSPSIFEFSRLPPSALWSLLRLRFSLCLYGRNPAANLSTPRGEFELVASHRIDFFAVSAAELLSRHAPTLTFTDNSKFLRRRAPELFGFIQDKSEV
jgi:hypothetical protein